MVYTLSCELPVLYIPELTKKNLDIILEKMKIKLKLYLGYNVHHLKKK